MRRPAVPAQMYDFRVNGAVHHSSAVLAQPLRLERAGRRRPLQCPRPLPILLALIWPGGPPMFRYRWVIAFAAIATALILVAGDAGDANARAGGGFSGGS